MCDGHHTDGFGHLEGFLNPFKTLMRGFRKPDRITIHVDLNIDFALGEITERKMPLIQRKCRSSFSQNVQGSSVLPLRVMEVPEVVVARRRYPGLTGFQRQHFGHSEVSDSFTNLIQIPHSDGMIPINHCE